MLTTDVVSGIGEDALVEGVVVEDGGDDVRVVDEGSEIEKTIFFRRERVFLSLSECIK